MVMFYNLPTGPMMQ